MNEHLRRALDALERGAQEAREASARSAAEVRSRISHTVDEVLGHMEADEAARDDPDDVISRLDRQAQEIAEELRRVDKLMRDRLGQE